LWPEKATYALVVVAKAVAGGNGRSMQADLLFSAKKKFLQSMGGEGGFRGFSARSLVRLVRRWRS
jgi:hypothetical protein